MLNKTKTLELLGARINVEKIWGCPCGSFGPKCNNDCKNIISFEKLFEEAFFLINDFYVKLLNSSELKFWHDILKHLFFVNEHYSPAKTTIVQGTKIYRARNNFPLEKIVNIPPFLGLDAKESFVPPRKAVKTMRANVAYHPVLYAASDETTAFYELRPDKNDIINLCTIETNRDLKLFNLCVKAKQLKIGELSQHSLLPIVVRALVGALFSEPAGTGDIVEEYIVTQSIAEYMQNIHTKYTPIYESTRHIESLKVPYDGICYNSQFSDGINYCIFNYDACKPTASRLVQVSDISFSEYNPEI